MNGVTLNENTTIQDDYRLVLGEMPHLVRAVGTVSAPFERPDHNHLLHGKRSTTSYQSPQVVLGGWIGENKVSYGAHETYVSVCTRTTACS